MDTILFFQPRRYGSWRRLLSGLQQYARENNWLIHVLSRPDDDSAIPGLLRNWNPRGCIMDCGDGSRPPADRFFGTTPIVFFNRDAASPKTRHPVLHQDSYAIARIAAEHLQLLGLKDFAFVPHASQAAWSKIRNQEFSRLVTRTGGRIHRPSGDITADWLLDLPKPCGLFAANDAVAQRVVVLAQANGIRIPEDLAVIGVDNDEIYCEGSVPGITSIGIDFDSTARRLGEVLSRTISAPDKVVSLQLYDSAHLVPRGSTRRFRRNEPGVMEALDFIRRFACSDRIGIDDVIMRMKCSRREATQRFRAATGRSILEEIHEVRFQRMCELLKTTDAKISAIINFSGYRSEAFPKRMFVRRTGMTMRAYRDSTKPQSRM